jgi:hypothetical protein
MAGIGANPIGVVDADPLESADRQEEHAPVVCAKRNFMRH